MWIEVKMNTAIKRAERIQCVSESYLSTVAVRTVVLLCIIYEDDEKIDNHDAILYFRNEYVMPKNSVSGLLHIGIQIPPLSATTTMY